MKHASSDPPFAGQPRYRELTPLVIAYGLIFGAILNAAITYAGLKIGFTAQGSPIAALVGFGVLRSLLRKGSIVEVNIGQTIASAVNTTSAGIIFTVPVLLMMDIPLQFGSQQFWMITLAGMAGGLLGVVYMMPLRKQMIEVDRLRFPSAVAVAAILKTPGAGASKSLVLAVGALVSALISLPAALPGLSRPAQLDELDALIARERITPAQAELTREISRWIESGSAPPAVLERGEQALALITLRQSRDAPGASAEDRKRYDDAVNSRVLPPGSERYNDSLARDAVRAQRGEIRWEELRQPANGWAAAAPPGYLDLGWRVSAREGEDGKLLSDVDRDGNGRPDLLLTDTKLDVGRLVGLPPQMALVFAIAPFAIGAGYLTGAPGLMVLAGGLLATLILNPFAYANGYLPSSVTAHGVSSAALAAFNRPLGIGLLLGGALIGVLTSIPAVREAVRGVLRSGGSTGGRDDLGFVPIAILVGTGVGALLLALYFQAGGDNSGLLAKLPWALRAAIIVLVAAVWIWFASLVVSQCSGMTDWSPVSGLALITVVLVMLLAGKYDVVAAVTMGAALCVAISCAADMMGDLKTGHLVGSVPRKQQISEILAMCLGPLVSMVTLLLIADVNLRQTGIPIGPGTPTVAAQADALRTVIRGIQGDELPYALYGIGAVLGIALGIAATAGAGVLIGLSVYLPLEYTLTYGLGCVLNLVTRRVAGARFADEWGVPFCAGLLIGEPIVQLAINFTILARG